MGRRKEGGYKLSMYTSQPQHQPYIAGHFLYCSEVSNGPNHCGVVIKGAVPIYYYCVFVGESSGGSLVLQSC